MRVVTIFESLTGSINNSHLQDVLFDWVRLLKTTLDKAMSDFASKTVVKCSVSAVFSTPMWKNMCELDWSESPGEGVEVKIAVVRNLWSEYFAGPYFSNTRYLIDVLHGKIDSIFMIHFSQQWKSLLANLRLSAEGLLVFDKMIREIMDGMLPYVRRELLAEFYKNIKNETVAYTVI